MGRLRTMRVLTIVVSVIAITGERALHRRVFIASGAESIPTDLGIGCVRDLAGGRLRGLGHDRPLRALFHVRAKTGF